MKINVWGNDSRINLNYVGIPRLNSSEYPLIAFRTKGSTNALIMLRLYSQNGQLGIDFPGFSTPPQYWTVTVMDMSQTPLRNQVLGPEAILSIKSADNDTA